MGPSVSAYEKPPFRHTRNVLQRMIVAKQLSLCRELHFVMPLSLDNKYLAKSDKPERSAPYATFSAKQTRQVSVACPILGKNMI
jgi:hypothetical protein